jgi:predicted dehydrogenase
VTRVCITGVGYWGKHLARNLAGLGALAAIADPDPERLEWAADQFPGVALYPDLKGALNGGEVDALVIATPPPTHYPVAEEALQAGCHVLIEKPFTTGLRDAEKLIALAGEKNLTLMAGFTFLYNAAVREVKEIIQSGELGDVYYVFNQRLNLGRVRSDVDVWWNLGPHDVSIILYWFGAVPVEVSGWGSSFLQDGISDVAFVSLKFEDGRTAFIHVSWLDPNKVRAATIVGSSKMVVYDDTSPDKKVQVLDQGIDRLPSSGSPPSFEDFAQFQLMQRVGDIHIPTLNFEEPLRMECRHFLDCIAGKAECLTGGRMPLDVLRVLEGVSRSFAGGGRPVRLDQV